jgi:hypothetical protein
MNLLRCMGLMVALVVPLLVIGQCAFADTAPPVAAPLIGASWTQTFEESGVYFDSIKVMMLEGGPFESPSLRNFTDADWQLTQEMPPSEDFPYYTAIGRGPSLDWLQFDAAFITDPSLPLSFYFIAYSGDTKVDWATASWSGTEWQVDTSGLPWDLRVIHHTATVPEPTTATLLIFALGFGLIAFGLKRF